MYLPRTLLSHLYTHLVQNTHPLSPPVLILVSLDPDALCACRILTALLKRDYIPHKVQPVAGYSELAAAGKDLVLPLTRQHGGQGGIVVCLGVGGLVDLEETLGLDGGEDPEAQTNMYDHGVEVWVVDARRPWNLQNVFGTGAMAPPEEQDTALTPACRVLPGTMWVSYPVTNACLHMPRCPAQPNANAVFMSNSYFLAMVMALAAVGSSINYGRAQDAGTYVVEQRDLVHDKAAKELRRVRQEKSGMTSKENRIDFFVRQREATMGSGDYVAIREERANRVLSDMETCGSEQIRESDQNG